MDSFIPLSVPNLKGKELEYVSKTIASEWVSSVGDFVDKFEKQFAAYAKIDDAVACQSGTAALHLALIVCGIGPGDIVIAPTLTFIASINPISYIGASPVFMDCNEYLCMDVDKLEKYLITECKMVNGKLYDKKLNQQIKAILAAHIFGNCVDMERLMSVAEKYELLVIEDAAEAVGTFFTSGTYAGMMAGTIGDMGAYSFNGNKIITTGGGGMIVSRDSSKLAHAKHLSTQAKADELYFEHDEVGYNYRMTNVQAALGVAQLERLEQFIKTKRENYFRYINLGIPLLKFDDRVRSNYWFYCYITGSRDNLIRHLNEHKIQARPIWKLNHLQKMYEKCRAYEIEKAKMYYEMILNIPCSSNLNKETVERVAEVINKYILQNDA